MRTVGLRKDDKKGTLTWDENDPAGYELDFPDEEIAQDIRRYLTAEREFKIPESQRLDDYRTDKAKPTENSTYFNLALSTLWANTGVLVDW